MPQFLVLMAAGAGLYSAYKWLSRESEKAASEANRTNEDLHREAQGGQTKGGPKDLGELVWDEKTGAYRPKTLN